MALFMGHDLPAMQLLGLLLIIASGFLLLRSVSLKGLRYIVAGVVLLSLLTVLSIAMIDEVGPAMTLLLSTTIGLVIKVAYKRRDMVSSWGQVKVESPMRFKMAFLMMVSIVFVYIAYDLANNASSVVALASTKTIVITLGAYAFLGERDHAWRKLAAAIVVAAGVVLIKLA